jgi:hypothetical protein
VYKPHDRADLEALVAEGLLDKEVAQRTTTPCGIWWFNRNRRVTYKEPDLDGGYRKRIHTEERPRNERIAVPVAGASIPREWVVAAREAIKDNRVPSCAGDRFIELSGSILYCGGCGKPMVAYNTYAGRQKKHLYHYYRCRTVASYGRAACPAKKVLVRAEPLEDRVWQMVSDVRADTAWEKVLRLTFEPKVDFYRLATSDL